MRTESERIRIVTIYNFNVNIFLYAIQEFFLRQKGEIAMKKYIFRASFTKDGITYYAKNYGKKAFKIPID